MVVIYLSSIRGHTAHATIEKMRALLNLAAGTAARYLENLDERSVAPSPEALAGLAELDEPLPERPTEAAGVLETLDRIGSPATMGMAGPALLRLRDRRLAAGGAGGELAGRRLGPERRAVRGLADRDRAGRGLAGLAARRAASCRPDRGGAFVTGATMANFTALAAARHAVLARAGWDVEADGLFGAPPITVVVGERGASVADQGAGPAGPGARARGRGCRWTGRGGCGPTRCRALGGPTIVCMQAGNVNTGAFDPAAEICARAHAAGAWVHVDGAFGLWAAASPRMRTWWTGVADADSWATDAHKWLNVPYDSGLAFVRDAAALHERDVGHRGLPAAGRTREPVAVHAGAVAAGARRGDLGGAAVAGPRGAGRPDRAHLPPRPPFRGGLARRRATRC